MREFKWLWQYLKKYRIKIAIALLIVTAVTAMGLINSYLNGIIVDKVIYNNQIQLLGLIIAILIGTKLIQTMLRYIFQLIFENVSQNILVEIRRSLYNKIQELEFEFFDKTRTGEIMSRMTGDLDAVRHFVAWVIYNIYTNVFMLIFVLIVMFSVNATFTFFMLAVTPIVAYLTIKLSSAVKPAFSEIMEQFARLNSVVQENIGGNRVVKAFAREDYEIQKFTYENERFKEANMKAASIWAKFLPSIEFFSGMLSVVVILVGGIMVVNDALTLGQLVTFNGYIWALNVPMRMSGWLINDVQRFSASAEKIMLLLERQPQIVNSESSIAVQRLKGEIEFRNVSFCFGEKQVLQEISFKAKPGQMIGIMGDTGSGKSSLINLITRFYDCSKGKILIDGRDIRDYDIVALRKNIGIAMQDVFMFSDTIEGNIAYGVPNASLDMVKWAAKLAGAHDFIMNMPEGYDTIIGERGVGLSGGQRQRVALARAILKNAPILILDDTTSSLDFETEHMIQKNLKDYYKDKTTFIIAHRVSSLRNADLILVLKDGKIIERGCHQELLDKKGYYYDVYCRQYGELNNEINLAGA